MLAAVIQSVPHIFSLSRLTGPIFDKELRVASRRRRSYVLRFLYVGALTAFVGVTWSTIVHVDSGGSSGYVISRMAEAGKSFASSVVWFQFVAMQLLAVATMSSCIYEETQRRTLAVLMSTPITGWQFVLGKLTSKLLPLFMLLALSLPVLAAARVLGGVPWDFIVSAICITASAMILVGSIALNSALKSTHPLGALAGALLAYFLLFVLLPGILGSFGVFMLAMGDGEDTGLVMLACMSPTTAMITSSALLAPQLGFVGSQAVVAAVSSSLSLLFSLLFLAAASRKVRKLGLVVMREGSLARTRRKARRSDSRPRVALRGAREAVQRVYGSPLVWKELRSYLPATRVKTVAAVLIVVCILVLSYAVNVREVGVHMIQIPYILFYVGLGFILTAALSAATITTEKESQALGLLLQLPVSDQHIILAKALGVLYRALPVWILLACHVGVFTLAGGLHPIFCVQLGLLLVFTVVSLTGMGLYFSTRFRTTASAALMTILAALVLWFTLPIAIAELLSADMKSVLLLTLGLNPLNQLVQLAKTAADERMATASLGSLTYDFGSFGRPMGPLGATGMVLGSAFLHVPLGLAFAWLAKRRLRRCIA